MGDLLKNTSNADIFFNQVRPQNNFRINNIRNWFIHVPGFGAKSVTD